VCKNDFKGPAHMALSVTEFLASKQITVLENPPYSPDLAPNNFFLFPKIKEILKGSTVVIIVGYHCYQLHAKFYPIFFSQG
jgi:hypothetical protein